MLCTKLSEWIIVSSVFFVINEAERRIKGGFTSETDKKYMVYLMKAEDSHKDYDFWTCGGAIVTKWFIITSAACIEDVKHLYVISGRKKYFPIIGRDICMNNMKKKVVFTCVPKTYELEYAQVETWSYIDIALAKVESMFALDDPRIYRMCDFAPQVVQINYEMKFQETGRDTIVMGWGHLDLWRKPQDTANYNVEDMHWASALILDKDECKEYYKHYEPLLKTIDKYMVCTLDKGNIDEKGQMILKTKTFVDGCTPYSNKRTKGQFFCEEDQTVVLDRRRQNMDRRKMFSRILRRQQANTRRQGICQNDHGSPLVSWVGDHDVVVGIASVFRVTNDSKCTGPFLYTSTYCNGAFLNCTLELDFDTLSGRRNFICDQPPIERGYDTISTTISWEHHPHGPAENEKNMMRPLSSLKQYEEWTKK